MGDFVFNPNRPRRKAVFLPTTGLLESHADLFVVASDLHANFTRFGLLVLHTAKGEGSVEKYKKKRLHILAIFDTKLSTVPFPTHSQSPHYITYINSTNEFCYLIALLSTSSITEYMFSFRVIWLASYFFFLLCASSPS
jgi:hypothetical protein